MGDGLWGMMTWQNLTRVQRQVSWRRDLLMKNRLGGGLVHGCAHTAYPRDELVFG